MSDDKIVVVLPEREQMLKALVAVNSDQYLVQDFYPLLLEYAGEEKYPEGIMLMVQLAAHEYLSQLPDPFNKVMGMLIDAEAIVAALIGDNQEAVSAAEAFTEKVHREMEKNPSVTAKVDDIPFENRVALYKAANRIVDIVLKFAEEHGLELSDNREEEVNPFYGQTENGFIIEMYYGGPSQLLTPWGKWNCWRSFTGSWDKLMPELLAQLDGFVYEEGRSTNMGEIGPFYGIRRVDDIRLPEPSKRKPSQFIEYEDVKAAWKELVVAV